MKIKGLFLVLITTVVIIVSFGCKPLISPSKVAQPRPQPGAVQQTPTTPAAPVSLEVYFPITLGSEWDYQGQGNEYASFHRKIMFREGSRAQFRDDNGATLHDNVVEFSTEGVARIYNQVSTGETKSFLAIQPTEHTFLLVTPLKVGTKWQVSEGYREIMDVNATVDTPAGTFKKCIHVQITSQDSVVNEYYCPGTGLVKQDFQAGDQVITSLLSRYSIK